MIPVLRKYYIRPAYRGATTHELGAGLGGLHHEYRLQREAA
jgi:hypothetical protein